MTNISFEHIAEAEVEEVVVMSAEEIALEIEVAETALLAQFESMDQEEEIEGLRASLVEVAIESDVSLLNHYREPLEAAGIDCTDAKTAAEGIAAVLEQFNTKQLEAAGVKEEPETEEAKAEREEAEAKRTEATTVVADAQTVLEEANTALEAAKAVEEAKEEDIAVAQTVVDEATAAVTVAQEALEALPAAIVDAEVSNEFLEVIFFVVVIRYIIARIKSIENRVTKTQAIIDKGLKTEPTNRDKKINMVTYASFARSVPAYEKAMSDIFSNLESYDAAAAKKTVDTMKGAGIVWNGKKYVVADKSRMSKLTVEQGGWDPKAITSAHGTMKSLVNVLIQSNKIEKQLKAASKKVNKGGDAEKAKEIKANRKLAGKTMRHIASSANSFAGVLLTVARQYEKK